MVGLEAQARGSGLVARGDVIPLPLAEPTAETLRRSWADISQRWSSPGEKERERERGISEVRHYSREGKE